MIYIDHPKGYTRPELFQGKPFSSSHMVSDLPGAEGTTELLEFGKKIGQKKDWLQKAGTYWEHFDVMNSRFTKAIDAGAQLISGMEMARIFESKKPKRA